MTLTFPRAMPARPPESVRFELNRSDFLSRERSGRLASIQAGFPLWELEMDLTKASAEAFDEVSAWFDSLEGSRHPFFGSDPSRPYPRAYRNGFAGLTRAGGGSFGGACTSWSVDESRAKLTLDGLPSGFILSPRDYVGFRWTTEGAPRRALVRLLVPAVADAEGTAADLAITPAVPGGASDVVPSDAVAYLDQPCCIMRLDPRQSRVERLDPLNRAEVRVTALQDLRP